MELTQVYDREFYGDQAVARTSARQILSLVRSWYKPSSVVDVGCGLGTWLSVWRELDPSVVVAGLDGNDVGESERYISEREYGQVDLTQDFAKSLAVARGILARAGQNGGGGNSRLPESA